MSPPAASYPLFATPLQTLSDQIGERFRRRGIKMTLGGEPTYVPDQPDGLEWNVAAVGPTKLGYAYRLADQLITRFLPGAVTIYSPGKHYPGEVNPRWVVNILAHRDGQPVAPRVRAVPKPPVPARALDRLKAVLSTRLGLPPTNWMAARDPFNPAQRAAVLPLDHDGTAWISERWALPGGRQTLVLLNAEGPAGLRLPLNQLAPEAIRRALTLEARADALHLFLPPLLQVSFRELLDMITGELAAMGVGTYFLEGYLPSDDANAWTRVGLTADPGVLEINVPPCETWHDYHRWLVMLETTTAACGLRSWKVNAQGDDGGTGGGNHLLFGGPSLEENPFFTRPAWIASMLRYFQAHPCLAYLFTGMYVGTSSQAPRPDESARDLYDLDMAYQYLAGLPEGENHSYIIGETLRHLHTDMSGNTHRSEISFDKFWNVSGPAGGTAGLIEFRAIESLPQAGWMSLVALLWQAVAVHTLEHPVSGPLINHGDKLHDKYFLPLALWMDLDSVFADLRAGGLEFPAEAMGDFTSFFGWRFPQMLGADLGGEKALVVKRACEGWPLLCETPSEGGSTSRFVDTSIERLEFATSPEFSETHRLFVNGRELVLMPFTGPGEEANGWIGCGLRYRRTALFPSLHPGIKPHLPLEIAITAADGHTIESVYRLMENDRKFQPVPVVDVIHAPDGARPAVKSDPALLTYDLRLE